MHDLIDVFMQQNDIRFNLPTLVKKHLWPMLSKMDAQSVKNLPYAAQATFCMMQTDYTIMFKPKMWTKIAEDAHKTDKFYIIVEHIVAMYDEVDYAIIPSLLAEGYENADVNGIIMLLCSIPNIGVYEEDDIVVALDNGLKYGHCGFTVSVLKSYKFLLICQPFNLQFYYAADKKQHWGCCNKFQECILL